MSEKPSHNQEVRYQPDFYIKDLVNLLGTLMEKVNLIDKIEFSLEQKSRIAGTMMAVTAQFQKIINVLTQWGYICSK